VYEAVVRGIERGPGDAAVRCAVRPDLPEWLARLTPAAVAELGLAEGSRVWLAVKSHSVRLASAPPRREARAAGIGTPAP
jgi:molybdopterin-binding protein